ncbi:MAG TPA: ABC transporter substrate-binding protein [Pseudolabrys sp.]|nr:ABC transporter substrate-binding protein [Pseudolabrys sp.]
MRQELIRRSGRLAVVMLTLLAPLGGAAAETTLRIGHFPNITHTQALVAHALSRQGKGIFERALGNDVKIEWYVYNAGPSAMEAILAQSIDVTYVGPNPAINTYAKSRGAETRILAGSADGGAALVVHDGSPLKAPADFKGKVIATPQFGNTQDISARAWLAAGGLKITQTGGDAQVVPTANPDQLSLFKQNQLDAVWTVEPWVSRLEMEANGKVLVDDKTSITTVLVTRVAFLAQNRPLLQKLVAAHKELTDWIRSNPEQAQHLAREELQAETHTAVPAELIARAWQRIVLTTDISTDALNAFVTSAKSAGFLRDAPDMGRLIEKP